MSDHARLSFAIALARFHGGFEFQLGATLPAPALSDYWRLSTHSPAPIQLE